MATDLNELNELLEQLSTETKPVPATRLYLFSDLARENLSAFRAAWDTFATERRQSLAQSLKEVAEASFEVNFDAVFTHLLQDPDAEVRAAAIEGLWENEKVSLIGPLLSMLRADPAERVRSAAAAGLGRFVLAGELEQLEPAIQARLTTELLTVLYTPDESVDVRRRAVESVAYACVPEVVEAIELAYYDDAPEMRLSAVVGMGRNCEKRWGDFVLQELESDAPAMRYEAAWACGELGLRRATPHLSRLIDDPDRQVCNATIWALGQIGGEQAKQILLAAIEEADEEMSAAIDEALAELALVTGDLDFVLYDLEQGQDEMMLEDEFIPLWSSDEDDDDPLDEDDWLS